MIKSIVTSLEDEYTVGKNCEHIKFEHDGVGVFYQIKISVSDNEIIYIGAKYLYLTKVVPDV